VSKLNPDQSLSNWLILCSRQKAILNGRHLQLRWYQYSRSAKEYYCTPVWAPSVEFGL